MKMKKLFNSYFPEPYVAPGCKVVLLRTRRLVCLSTGNLDEDKFGGLGYAGGDASEEDGGSLF